MYKVLFISAFHPGAIGSIGAGEAICGDNLRKLIAKGYMVDVVVSAPSTQHENADIKKLCRSYELIDANKIGYFLGILRNILNESFIAPWFFTRINNMLIKHIKKSLSQEHYDMVWLDFPSVLGVVNHIKHENIIYFAHDIVCQRTNRSVLKKPISFQISKIEARLFSKLSSIVTMSEKDKQLIEDLKFLGSIEVTALGIQKVGEVYNSVPIENVVSRFDGKFNIVFFGNMKRSENHWSILWFVFFVFLNLMKKKPNIHLWILGLGPRALLKFAGRVVSNVHVIGPVSDPTLAFKQANLSVAPLLYGAGVKIKVLQMLDAGAEVVATPIGAEGIQQHEKLHVVDKSQFGRKILELME